MNINITFEGKHSEATVTEVYTTTKIYKCSKDRSTLHLIEEKIEQKPREITFI